MFVKGPHPCWQAQKALDDAGVDYVVAKHPPFPRGRRKDLIARTGQSMLPTLELDDGTVVRVDHNELVTRIRAGEFGGSAAG
jgi:hypothetical protein